MGPTLPRSNSVNSALTEEQLNQMRNVEVQKANAALQNIQSDAAKNPEAFKEALLQLNKECGTWSAEDVQKYVQEVNPNLVTSLIVPEDSLSETQYQERIENAIARTLYKRKIVHHTNPDAAEKLYLGMKKAHEAKQMLKEGKCADYKKAQQEAKKLWSETHRIEPDMEKTIGFLGRGGSGSVESVVSKEGGPIVVKKTLFEEVFQKYTEKLKQEYAYIRSLDHPNIITALYSSPEEERTMLLESGGTSLGLLFYGKNTKEFKIKGLSKAMHDQHGRLNPKALQQMRVAQIVENAIYTKTSVDYDDFLEEAQQIYETTSFSRQDIDKILSTIDNRLERAENSQTVKFLEDMQKKCSVWKLQIAQKLHSEGPLPMQNLQHIAKQLGEGLAYLHQKGIVHLDIKADNVLIQPDGTVKIIDFGLSRFVADYQRSPYRCGTLGYMAPEMINLRFDSDGYPQGCSEAVDVYSAGCLLCQLATGSSYYTPTNTGNSRGRMSETVVTTTVNQKSLQQKVNDNIAERYPDDQNAEKAEQLKDLLAKMLEPFPEKRISMQNALEHPFFQ